MRRLQSLAVLMLGLTLAACRSLPEPESGSSAHSTYATPPEKIVDWSRGAYNKLANENLLPIYKRLGEPEWYCSCPIKKGARGGRNSLDLRGCNLGRLRQRQPINAPTLSWEHVVPQSWLQAGSRDEPGHESAIRDPYNLVPATGALNTKRWYWPFAEIDGEDNGWLISGREAFDGDCDFEVSEEEDLTWIEPPNHLKGDIARITLYMYARYGFSSPIFKDELSVDIPAYLTQMREWSREDPLSEDERKRLHEIGLLVEWSDTPATY